MKDLFYSTKIKRDLKKYRNDPIKMCKLYEVLDMLVNDIDLPERYRKHKLIGQYKECWECHVESDLLLIWIDEKKNLIELIRFGSHSELFG